MCKKKHSSERVEYLMKIYLNSPKESWVVDRFVKEWRLSNPNLTTKFRSEL